MTSLLSCDRLRARLLWVAGGLGVAGLSAEVCAVLWPSLARSPLLPFLSLSYEQNLPTWYASGLLLACAGVLGLLARAASLAGDVDRRAWWGLAGAFLYASLDEAVGLHEHLGVLELHGVLYFSWVVPGAGLVALFALVFLPFLRRLPARPRRQFLLAGGLYVAGALGMELPLGWWTERAGDDTLVYAVLDHVEEVLELVGASLFLAALVEQLGLRLRVTLAAEGQPEEGAHGHAARRAG